MGNVELSKEKLDIDEMAETFEILIKELQTRRNILIAGLKLIDEGNSMLNGSGILSSEVRKIMREGLEFINA